MRAISRSCCCGRVISRAIVKAPMTFPELSLIGETVAETWIILPSLVCRNVSKRSTFSPRRILPKMKFSSSCRSAGISRMTDVPTISLAVYPKTLSAPGFQSVMVLFRSLPMMASSEEPTIAAKRLRAASVTLVPATSILSIRSGHFWRDINLDQEPKNQRRTFDRGARHTKVATEPALTVATSVPAPSAMISWLASFSTVGAVVIHLPRGVEDPPDKFQKIRAGCAKKSAFPGGQLRTKQRRTAKTGSRGRGSAKLLQMRVNPRKSLMEMERAKGFEPSIRKEPQEMLFRWAF